MNGTEPTLFRQAVQLYRNGDRDTAQQYMRRVLLENPDYVPGWIWMSALVDDETKQRECLERALTIDPQCEPAQRGLRILRLRQTARAVEAAQVQETTPQDEITQNQHTSPAQQVAQAASALKTDEQDEQVEFDTEQLLANPELREAGRLGQYLVEQQFITARQLDEALEEQRLFWKKFQGVRAPLGNILINNGVLTPQMLATALVAQQHDRLHGKNKQSPQYIGEYLVAQGVITSKQLESVLAEQIRLRQRGTSLLIGELLIHAGYVTREVLEDVLEQQREELFSRFGFDED